MSGIAIILLVSVVSLLADLFLKKASDINNNFMLFLGIFLYAIDALLWFYAYKYSKFSTVGIIYSLFIIFSSILIGIFFFKEKIALKEVIGIGLGIVAMYLLTASK